MGEWFYGEIRLFPYSNPTPAGWIPCDGRVLQANQYPVLCSCIGFQYGGNGRTTFAVPDLRGRAIFGGTAVTVGQIGGIETVTLNTAQIPSHSHDFLASQAAATKIAMTGNLATPPGSNHLFSTVATNVVPMAAGSISSSGGGGAHENRQPYLAMQYLIANSGYVPPRS